MFWNQFTLRLKTQYYVNKKSSFSNLIGNTKIGSLFWADDIVILSESKNGLQHSLNQLSQYCYKNEMKINVDKTKCMIFNKSGRILNYNKFYYNNQELEIVKNVNYLGFLITPSFSIKKLLDDLYKRGLKAYFKLRNCLDESFRNHVHLFFNLFDTLIKPILMYGIELWGSLKQGFNDMNPIEKLNTKLCKHILGVTKCTSNIGCRCELGRKQLHILGFKTTIKNWLRVINDPINSILKTIYVENLNQGLNWTKNLKEIFMKHGLGDIWISTNSNSNEQPPPKQVVSYISQRIIDVSVQDTLSTLRNQSKMHTYCLFKKDFEREQYVTEIKNPAIRKTISKFRLSDHKLDIETQRYHRPKKGPDERICITCGEVEDEIHCLMSCKLNIDEREKLFSKISEYNKTFNRLNDKAKFIYLLGSTQICDENVYQFVNQCLKNSYSVKK